MEYIQGEKFYNVADFIYQPKIKPEFDDYNVQINTFDIDKLNDVNIVYTHSLYVKHLFNVIKELNKLFIIITHNSDVNINNTFEIPKNVIKWYTQNVDVINDKIESIPIGLENNKWFPELNKLNKIKNIVNSDKNIKNLVYVNHSLKGNIKDRNDAYKILANKSWVTIDYGSNGNNFDNYLNNLYNHKFMVCPIGNGIDTHRTWESLYVNTIPIEIRNKNNRYYEDLPICFVDNWEELTEDFLQNEYSRIKSKSWNLDKLDFCFWKNKIIKNKINYK